MKIAIDLHGVLVDFAGPCREKLGISGHANQEIWDFYRGFMSVREFEQKIKAFSPSFWVNLPFYWSSAKTLDAVREFSDEFVILTHAPSEAAKRGSRDLCSDAIGDVPVICVDRAKDKGDYADHFDVLIDDKPQNVRDFIENGGVGVLWARPYNRLDRDGLFCVHGPNELRKVLTLLNQAFQPFEEDEAFEPVDEAESADEADSCEVRVVNEETGAEKCAKPIRMDLIPTGAMEEFGKCYHYGTQKYAAHNFRKGYPFSLSLAALYRHLNAWNGGEDNDPESGVSHLMHVAWHCFAMVQSQLDFGDKFDDRFKPEEEADTPGLIPRNEWVWRVNQMIANPHPTLDQFGFSEFDGNELIELRLATKADMLDACRPLTTDSDLLEQAEIETPPALPNEMSEEDAWALQIELNDTWRDLEKGEVVEEGDRCWKNGTGPWGVSEPASVGTRYRLDSGCEGMYRMQRKARLVPDLPGYRYLDKTETIIETDLRSYSRYPWGSEEVGTTADYDKSTVRRIEEDQADEA